MSEGLYRLLTRYGRSNPTKTILEGPDRPGVTYGEFIELVERMAGAIAARVESGDRVMVQVEKSPEALAVYLATLATGAVFSPLNPAYTGAEVQALVDDARPALRIAHPSAALGRAATTAGLLELDDRGRGSLIDAAVDAGPFEPVKKAPDAPAVLIYTSGTTGRAKGVVLSDANLASNAEMLRDAWRFDTDDRLLHMLPLFHVHGLFVALHPVLLVGASVSLHRRFDVGEVIRDLPRCTVVMGVPTMYGRLLTDERLDRLRCSQVRLFTSGSAPLSPHIHRRFTERTGHAIVERYGMTETGIITSNPYDGDRIPGTVGYPLSGVELRVIGGDGTAAAPGVSGSVETTGPNVFGEYWNRPDATAAAFTADGWLRTGDIGRLAEDGRLTLEGRTSDLIISGGLNIAPRQVEEALESVRSIGEIAIVGIPHPDLGEAVVAFVVSNHLDSAELEHALEGVARYKHPKRYVVLPRLPRNAMGKVEKSRLRRTYSGLFTDDG